MTTIPDPTYKVKKVTLEEIEKRDKIKAALIYGPRASYRASYRPSNVHMNGATAADPANHPSGNWPASGSTRW